MDNLIWANVQHRPTRSLATALGVAVSTVLILLTVGLARGVLHERSTREAKVGAEIQVRSSGTMTAGIPTNQPSLPIARAEEIKKIAGVKIVSPIIQYVQASDSGLGFRAIEAINFEEYSQISGIRLLEGAAPQTDEEVIIDDHLVKERKVKTGQEIEVMGRMMKISGVYGPESGARIKMRLSTMQERLAAQNLCSMLLVKCESPAVQDAVAIQIQRNSDARVLNDKGGTEVADQVILTRDLPNFYARGLPALDTFLNVVVGVAMGISILVTLLAMYTTVSERTREIGILKSLGAPNSFILRVIEQEALVISAAGALLGYVLALSARFGITHATSIKNIEFEPHWILITFVIALAGGAIGALYPAWRAVRLDPVKALSYE
ncbi:MAG: ABC transporter permease [Acidobacteria bacterium]|nr:ABC transporter permease [Acidobacteriota bacterium]